MTRPFNSRRSPLRSKFCSGFTDQEKALWEDVRQDFLAKEVDPDSERRYCEYLDVLGNAGMSLLMRPFDENVEDIETEQGFSPRSLKCVVRVLLQILQEKIDG